MLTTSCSLCLALILLEEEEEKKEEEEEVEEEDWELKNPKDHPVPCPSGFNPLRDLEIFRSEEHFIYCVVIARLGQSKVGTRWLILMSDTFILRFWWGQVLVFVSHTLSLRLRSTSLQGTHWGSKESSRCSCISQWKKQIPGTEEEASSHLWVKEEGWVNNCFLI